VGCGKLSRMWVTLWQWGTEEETEKPYEFRATRGTVVHLLR